MTGETILIGDPTPPPDEPFVLVVVDDELTLLEIENALGRSVNVPLTLRPDGFRACRLGPSEILRLNGVAAPVAAPVAESAPESIADGLRRFAAWMKDRGVILRDVGPVRGGSINGKQIELLAAQFE